MRAWWSYLAVLYLVALVLAQDPCSVRVEINPNSCATDPSVVCSLEQGLAVCQNTTCEDRVNCTVYSTQQQLNSTGNANLSYGTGSLSNIFSLKLSGLRINLDKGYFLELMDTGIEKIVMGYIALQGGDQQSAVRIKTTSATSVIDVSLRVSNCSQGILEVDSPGQVNLALSTAYTQKTGDCMVRVDAYETTKLGHTLNNILTSYDSHVTGDGGLLCVIGHSENVDVILPHMDCAQCSADRGGVVFIQGPGNMVIENQLRTSSVVSARLGSFVYAEDFNNFSINRTELQVTSSASGADYGAVYATSSRPNATFSIEETTMGPHAVHHDGGCLYIERVEHVFINKVNFTDCKAANGTGGGVVFKDVPDVHLIQSNFEACQALHGAAASCLGTTDNLVDYSLRAYRSSSTSLNQTTLDFYSEGQCAGALWDSQTTCPYLPRLCKSCGGSVCSVSDYGCFCYCDLAQEHIPDGCPRPSPTPTISPSSTVTASATPSGAVSSPVLHSPPPPSTPSPIPTNGTQSPDDGPSFWAGVGVGALVIVLLVVLTIAVLLLLNSHFKWHRYLRSESSVEMVVN